MNYNMFMVQNLRTRREELRQGGETMTDMKRISICIPPAMEKKLAELRKTDKFCRMSWSEIIRSLISTGLDSESQ